MGADIETRRTAYAEKTGAAILDELAGMGRNSGRNTALYRFARRLAAYVARGYLSDGIRDELRDAARRAGLSGAEIGPTINSGWRDGTRDDPHFPDELRDGALPALRPNIEIMPPPSPPPADEVAALWARCRPIYDTAAAKVLPLRGLDAARIEDGDLARELCRGTLPTWGRSWRQAGCDVVLRLFDWRGDLVSLHARNLHPDLPEDAVKALSPTGCGRCGLVLADAMAQELLRLDAAPPCWSGHVNVMEGATDFLRMASMWSDAATELPATISYIKGSFSADLAQRIPTGATVKIWPHKDEAGAVMAHQWANGLSHCEITWGDVE